MLQHCVTIFKLYMHTVYIVVQIYSSFSRFSYRSVQKAPKKDVSKMRDSKMKVGDGGEPLC